MYANLLIIQPSDYKFNNCLLALYTILVVLILLQYINFRQTFTYSLHFPQTHFNPLLTKKLTVAPTAARIIVFTISCKSKVAIILKMVPDKVPISVVLSSEFSIFIL